MKAIMRRLCAAASCVFAFVAPVVGDEPPSPEEPVIEVTDVSFRQRYPWNGLVDIDCTVNCSDPTTNITLYVSAKDEDSGRRLSVRNVWLEDDATHTNALSVTAGRYRLVWDAEKGNSGLTGDNVAITVRGVISGAHSSARASGDCGPVRTYANGSDYFLGNDFFEVGMTCYGALGSASSAPTSGDVIFHPYYGYMSFISLLDYSFTTDFFYPAYQNERWELFENGSNIASGLIGGGSSGIFNYEVVNDSTDALADVSVLNSCYSGFAVEHNIMFSSDNLGYLMTVRITNTSESDKTNVRYVRRCDPDQASCSWSGTSSPSTDNYYYQDDTGNVYVYAFANNTLVSETEPESLREAMVAAGRGSYVMVGVASQNYSIQAVSKGSASPSFNWHSYYDDTEMGLQFSIPSIPAGETVELYYIGTIDKYVNLTEADPFGGYGVSFVSGSGVSEGGILDLKTGARIANGTERLSYSPCWGDADSCSVEIDGETVLTDAGDEGEMEWAPTEPGAHILTHTAGETIYTAQFTVLGDDVAAHRGTLPASEVWGADKVHLVTSAVSVPDGVELTIEEGAVVKFMPGASLTVSSSGLCTAYGVVFTHVNDDTIGGDTLMDGDETAPVMGDYNVAGSVYEDDDTEYRYLPPQTLSSYISYDTRLRGYRTYIVSNSVTVASGATLTLKPGTIFKFAPGISMTVYGTLDAKGTRAAPVVFTSLKDDEHGGDTNGDGDATYPQPGDWKKIAVYGVANLDNTRLYYASSGSGTEDAILVSGGTVHFRQSEMAFGQSYAVGVESGHFYAENSIIREYYCAFRHWPYDPIINSVIYNCNRLSNNNGQKLYNCVIVGVNEAWDWSSGGGNTYSHCVFWNEPGFGLQSLPSSALNSNGNVWGDPKFVDPDNGDFRIAADSPCVDAGDGAVAPEEDYWGQPRMDAESRDTGKPNADGICPDIGIYEVEGKLLIDLPDFTVSDLMIPAAAVIGGKMEISYTISNIGVATNGVWRDLVSFETEAGSIVQSVVSETAFAPAESNGYVVVTKNISVPSLDEGLWRIRVDVNRYRDVFERTSADNNWTESENMVELSLSEASLEETFSGTVARGEPVIAKFTAPPGQWYALKIAVPAGAVVSYGIGSMPSAGWAYGATVGADGFAYVSIPASGTVYVQVSSERSGVVTMSPFAADMTVQGVSPGSVPQSGEVTLNVAGLHFEYGCTVSLKESGGGALIASESVRVESSESLTAKFDSAKLAAGTTYDVVVATEEISASLARAVTVSGEKGEAKLEARLDMPTSLRQGRSFVFYIDYANTGNVDMPAPIFTVNSEQMIFTTDYATYTNSVKIIGLGAEGSAGVLKPGEHFRMPVRAQVKPSAESSAGVPYSLSSAWVGDANAGKNLQLESIVSPQWVYDNFGRDDGLYEAIQDSVGRTWGEFYWSLGRLVTALYDGSSDVLDYDLAVDTFAMCTSLSALTETEEYRTKSFSGRSGENKETVSKLAKSDAAVAPWDNCKRIHRVLWGIYVDDGEWGEELKYVLKEEPDAYYALGSKSKACLDDNSHPGDVWEFCDCGWWHRPDNNSFAGVTSKIAILNHGLNDSIQGNWATKMAAAFVSKGYRVLCIDHGDHQQYGLNAWGAASYIPDDASKAFENLKRIGVNGSYVTLVGHSHGGHFAGHIMRKFYDAGQTPRDFIGLDTSPIYAHPVENASFIPEAVSRVTYFGNRPGDRYPHAWKDEHASHVEFYKSSWWYSMGTREHTPAVVDSDVQEVYGRPSFFLVKDQKGSFTGDNPANAEIGTGHHGYSRTWLTSELSNGNKNLLTGLGCDELYRAYTGFDCDYPKNTFAGVIRGSRMECGKALVDELAALDGFKGRIDVVKNWRLKEILGKASKGKSGEDSFPTNMHDLQNVMALITEYHLDDFTLGGDGALKNGEYAIVGLKGYNAADNYSTSYTFAKKLFSQLPWALDGNKGIGPQIWAVELKDEDKLAAKYGTATPLTKQEVYEIVESHAVCPLFSSGRLTSSDWFCYPNKDGRPTEMESFSFKFAGTLAKLDIRWNGRQAGVKNSTPMENGEKVLFIAVAGALRNHREDDKEVAFYPYDLLHDDDCMAIVKTVFPGASAKAQNGSGSLDHFPRIGNVAQKSSKAKNELPLPKSPNREAYTVSDDNDWQADKDGSWSVRLTGIDSLSVTNIVAGMWTGEDCTVSTEGWSENPNISVSGTLPHDSYGDFVPAHEYSVTLKIKDEDGKTDEVTHSFTIYRHVDDDEGDYWGGGRSNVPQSCDPNEMVGPEGVGEQRYIRAGEWMDYTIFFENKADAKADAQFVTVENPLSEWLDWSTFEMGDVGFGTQIDTGLTGCKNGTSEVTINGTNLAVRTEVALDEETGVVSWFLRIVDPDGDSDGWPYADNPVGFLPPNDQETHCGEGHLTYRIRVREDAPAGVVIGNSATIVFDYNEPIETDPAWWNTVAEVVSVKMTVDGIERTLSLIVGQPYGELPELPARDGYVFGGWYTGPNGTGRRVNAQSIVESGDGALYEHWLKNAYTVRFNANGGTGVMSNQAFVFDEPQALDGCGFEREGHTFMGWATDADGLVTYGDRDIVVNLASDEGAIVDFYAVWLVNYYAVTFDANGGTGGWSKELKFGTPLVAPEVVREGYSFKGWSPVPGATVPARDITYVAQWEHDYLPIVTFDANGGVGGWSRALEAGSAVVAPVVTRKGYEFAGWLPAFGGMVPKNDATYVAQWTRVWIPPKGKDADGNGLYGEPSLSAGTVWNGWIVDGADSLKGVLQVKVGKPNSKSGEAKVTANVTMAGAKKEAVAMTPIGAGKLVSTGKSKSGPELVLEFGETLLAGTYGTWDVLGSVSGFVSKDKTAQAAAEAALAKWLGPVNVAWPAGDGWNSLSVTIAKKGKVKAAGTLPDGSKLSGTGQVSQGDEWSAVPVVVTKKTPVAFMLWLGADGDTVELEGLDGGVAGKPGTLAKGAAFDMDVEAFVAKFGDATFRDFLPHDVAVSQAGTKWNVPKAGKIAYQKGTKTVDEAKAGENPSALKLTYNAKTGAYKGSFKVYADSNGKPKGIAAKLAGVMIRGVAYGSATIKKLFNFPFMIW